MLCRGACGPGWLPWGPALGPSVTVKAPALVGTRALDSSGTRAGTRAGTKADTRKGTRAGTSWGTWGGRYYMIGTKIYKGNIHFC